MQRGYVRVRIEGPDDPADPAGLGVPYVVRVWCRHGSVSLPWRRSCRNGCQRGGPAMAARCRRVSPSMAELRLAGVSAHGARHGCGCAEAFWMAEGPPHPLRGFHIQPEDWLLDEEGYEELGLLGPAAHPWRPWC